ncbi:hypothetical protein Tco_0471504 [Tanacetum coccineum]
MAVRELQGSSFKRRRLMPCRHLGRTEIRFKEAEMTRTAKVIENVLDVVISIILLENVQNHQKTRTKEHSSEVIRVRLVALYVNQKKDMQNRRNDFQWAKNEPTLLLASPVEHQLNKKIDPEVFDKPLHQNGLCITIVWMKQKFEPDTTVSVFPTASVKVTTVSTTVGHATLALVYYCGHTIASSAKWFSKIKYRGHYSDLDGMMSLKEMDIKWNMALLSMRADRFWKKTGKKITIQGSDSTRSRIEVEERAQEGPQGVKSIAHSALMALDGMDGMSFMAEENEASENQALIAEEVCYQQKNTENLTTKISKLREELFDSESDLCNYKRGLSQVEASLFTSHARICLGTGYPLPDFLLTLVNWDSILATPSVDVTNDVRSELDGNNLTVCEHGGTSSNACVKAHKNITQSSNVRSNNFGPPIIEDWDSEDESDTESTPIESIRSTINQNRDQPRGNQRNWNNLKSQHLGKDFVMQNKACYKCGSFEHLKVPTARIKNPTVGIKVPTAKPTVAVVKGNKGKVVKASTR